MANEKLPEIQQITSAGEWCAVYAEDGQPRAYPLVCWALLSNGEVVGLDLDGDCAPSFTDCGNFIGYAPDKESVESTKWYNKATNHQQKETKA